MQWAGPEPSRCPGRVPECRLHEPLEAFLRQAKDEVSNLAEGYRQLEQILGHLETES